MCTSFISNFNSSNLVWPRIFSSVSTNPECLMELYNILSQQLYAIIKSLSKISQQVQTGHSRDKSNLVKCHSVLSMILWAVKQPLSGNNQFDTPPPSNPHHLNLLQTYHQFECLHSGQYVLFTICSISMGQCKKDVTPLLTHWSYVFLAQTHLYVFYPQYVPTVGSLAP